MKIIEKKISDIIPYENNPRNNEDAVPVLMESIREFGFKVPIILDKDNVIIAGHTRLKAAERLGMETVPCIIASDLSEEQVRAFRLADNKVAELSSWDFDKLTDELSELSDMAQYGFLSRAVEAGDITSWTDDEHESIYGNEEESVVCPRCKMVLSKEEALNDENY